MKRKLLFIVVLLYAIMDVVLIALGLTARVCERDVLHKRGRPYRHDVV